MIFGNLINELKYMLQPPVRSQIRFMRKIIVKESGGAPIQWTAQNHSQNITASSQQQNLFDLKEKEHAALQAWCLLMNAYLEDAPSQQKSKLLKEWQEAEHSVLRTNTSP